MFFLFSLLAFAQAAPAIDTAVQMTRAGGVQSTPAMSPDGTMVAYGSERGPKPGRVIRVARVDGSDERQLTSSARDQAPSWSPDGRRILFESFRDGNAEIYVMDANGQNQRRLTENQVYDSGASWSPDGKSIMWFSANGPGTPEDDYGASDLWTMRADGSGKRRIARLPGSDTYPSWAPDGRRVVFTSHRHGNGELYLLDLQTSQVTRLTDHPASDDHARWSPDGRNIAFLSWRDGDEALYVLSPGSNAPVRVNTGRSAAAPSWSSDGKWILFHSRTDSGTEIFRVRAPQAEPERVPSRPVAAQLSNVSSSGARDRQSAWSPDSNFLVFVSDRLQGVHWGESALYLLDLRTGRAGRVRRSIEDGRPSWSPDGRYLAFESTDRDESRRIYVSAPDGRSSRNLTPLPGSYGHPAWSPDSTQIAFAGRPASAKSYDIYRTDLTGRPGVRVSDGVGQNTSPTWSADGKSIAFVSDRDGNKDIYVTSGDGAAVRRLTNNPGLDDVPQWSPDGRSILFASERDGNSEIYVMCADGSNARNVTRHPAFDSWPSWSADGRWMSFTSMRTGNMDIFIAPAPSCAN